MYQLWCCNLNDTLPMAKGVTIPKTGLLQYKELKDGAGIDYFQLDSLFSNRGGHIGL
ncbi:hypothetical protein [Flavobacterium turcicum]|uniref:Uncharacterized protein n=1 Tax=Flavobacterium turcicum TaxID=2764718 RepID=A0ABR7JE51_9FLAO|nr:hypothetical protein [Flavobacterium turcicum]MBC5862526.1 hypothetical protein [Flavobacterium turcicum]NHL01257.1 hypothetical protein [Flavobacterium turcicum]